MFFGAEVMSLQVEFDDVVFVERRRDIRIIVSVPGRYSLADHRNARGERRVYACRAVNVSPQAIALATPVSGAMGERVIAHIDHLGKLEGVVMRLLDRGFVMSIVATDDERDKLADKIEWLEKHKNHDATEQRADSRFTPASPFSWMILPEGRRETCLVVDLSVSGAAVSADTVPKIGTVVAIGLVVGRVVRHFEGAFAVKFVQRQSRDSVEAMVIRN
jgi:PilZ domain